MHNDNKFDMVGAIAPNDHDILTFDASTQKVFKGVDNVVVGGVRRVAAVGCPPRCSVELGLVWSRLSLVWSRLGTIWIIREVS